MAPTDLCDEDGCEKEGCECTLPDGTLGGRYCTTHAFRNGFCKGCGMFWAGIESFDFGSGYCDNCRTDWDEPEWDEDDSDWPFDAEVGA